MRKILFIVLAFLAVGSFAFADPGEFKPGSEPDGFRGIKWETELSTLSGMKYLRTDPTSGGIRQYTKKNDDLMIGGAKIESIEYGFWQGKFCSVFIRTKGPTNFTNLREATFEKFGEGFQDNKYIKNYGWFPKITKMVLGYDDASERGYLLMLSLEIWNQQTAWDGERAKEGAKKGF
ncbi:MAG: hypothetical protein WC081_05675 [Candidatus Ratteibacteria bacterium]|jgi:hypothetical protein